MTSSGTKSSYPRPPQSLNPSEVVLRKASEARVDTRLRRYYLIVQLLPYIFFSSLSSFEFDIV